MARGKTGSGTKHTKGGRAASNMDSSKSLKTPGATKPSRSVPKGAKPTATGWGKGNKGGGRGR